MPPLTPAALRKQIASGETRPLYALVGEDDVEKSVVAGEFADMVDEGLRAFNVDRLYGGEIKVGDLVQATATLPMMAPRRIVIILDGEKLLSPKRKSKVTQEESESKATQEEQVRLEAFLKAPPLHATTVFVCGPMDSNRRVVKLLKKEAHVVDCGTIGDDDVDAERWVKKRAGALGISLESAAVKALVQRAGLDIARLRGGLERLALFAVGQPAITAEDVREAVPAGPEARADFGIANAIKSNDAARALRELRLALDAGVMPVVLMGQLRWVAEQLPAPRLRNAIEALFRTDLALKSSGGEPRVLLERLAVELCEERKKPGRSTRTLS